jgi:uncharacterized protein YbjT (DUF2867 family)
MVGDGVLRCLITSPGVDQVVAVSRKPLQVRHAKLDAVIEGDMFHLQRTDVLRGFDACFFCLGASSAGMNEAEYRNVTLDLTLALASQLSPGNPQMVFEFTSGAGAGTRARQMWRRVKGETEEALFAMGLHDVYALQPGFIQPLRGSTTRHRPARWIYALTAALYPFLQKRFDSAVTSTDLLAKAMLQLATAGNGRKTLKNGDLNQLARGLSANSALKA